VQGSILREGTDDLVEVLLWNQLDGTVSVPIEEKHLSTLMGSPAGSFAGIENSQNLSTGPVRIRLRTRLKNES
jgi:hypothetical protein